MIRTNKTKQEIIDFIEYCLCNGSLDKVWFFFFISRTTVKFVMFTDHGTCLVRGFVCVLF